MLGEIDIRLVEELIGGLGGIMEYGWATLFSVCTWLGFT